MIKNNTIQKNDRKTLRAGKLRKAAAMAMAGTLAAGLVLTGCSKKTANNNVNTDNVLATDSEGNTVEEGVSSSDGTAADGSAAADGDVAADEGLVPEVVETYEAPTYEEGTNDGRVAMTVNGRNISFPSAVFFAMTARDYYKQYYNMYGMELDSSFWGSLADEENNLTYADAALDEVRLTLLQTAILDEHISEYGPEGLSESVITDAQAAVDNMFSSITEENLSKAGITIGSFEDLKTMYYNSYIVRQRIINDFTYEPTAEESRTLDIRIFTLSTDSGNGGTDEPEGLPTIDEAAQSAEAALERIKAGEDAATVLGEIGTTASQDTLYATQYSSNPLLDAILALNEGESTVFKDADNNSVYGIICDAVNKPESLEATKEAIRTMKAQNHFAELYSKWEEASEHTVDEEVWKEIKNLVFAD
jgi:hypothetical protein